jgi:hypothetical protein
MAAISGQQLFEALVTVTRAFAEVVCPPCRVQMSSRARTLPTRLR